MISHFTPTVPPIEALITFGVSAKESPEAIGRFGTGFKYSVAGILRMGGSIEVVTPTSTCAFGSREAEIRGKMFRIVTISEDNTAPRDLGFTTDTGRDWLPWMFFRELHSNTLDEGGRTVAGEFDYKGEGCVIYVSLPEYDEAFESRRGIFLSTEPKHKHDEVEFHPLTPETSEFIYYRGVRVGKAAHKLPFVANITNRIALTEDRVVASVYDYEARLFRALESLPIAVTAEVCRANADDETFHLRGYAFNHVEELYKRKIKLPRIEFSRVESEVLSREAPTACELDEFESALVRDACAKARRMGYRILREDVTVTEAFGPNILGRVHDGRIYITRNAISVGEKQLLMTILEEHFHLQSGAEDFTRRFQDYILEQIVTQYDRSK